MLGLLMENFKKIIRSTWWTSDWFSIPLKDLYIFKITELKNSFKLKLIIDSVILNKYETFSETVNK